MMRKIKLLKSLLIPTLGISAIGTIATVSTSCSCGDPSVSVTSVSLSDFKLTLAVREQWILTDTVWPEDATDKSVTWSSDEEDVATVTEDGTVTAIAEGKATITATSVDNPSATATCEVTVVNNPYVVVTAFINSTLILINYNGNNPNLQYSTDEGETWSTYSEPISIGFGQSIWLKGNNPDGWSHSTDNYSTLYIRGIVSINGNVMGLLDNGPRTSINIPCDYCFYQLFIGSSGITNVCEYFLPATSLKTGCYAGMFAACSELTTAPVLPAITLSDYCYNSMFSGCARLTIAPELNARSLVNWCYANMFSGCSTLTTAYLPATDLADWCYSQMFAGCSHLNSIKIDYIGNVSGTTAFSDWVDDVAETGTFYYRGNDTLSHFGFPEGWILNNNNYLYITANKNSTLILTNKNANSPDLQYSTDKGENWYSYRGTISINQGQSIWLKGNNPDGWLHSETTYSTLSVTGDVSVSGNVMGLLDNGALLGEDDDIVDIPCSWCFYELFHSSTGITNVSADFLTATSLTIDCYWGMFYGCSALTTAPILPAMNLADNCYVGMFSFCSSLTSIKIDYTGNYDGTYFLNWVMDIANSGTFYYNGEQTAQDFQLPEGWSTERF